MALTKQQNKRLKALVRDYANSCRSDQVKGGGHPEEMDEITEWNNKAKKLLYKYIDNLSKGEQNGSTTDHCTS